ncbi:hypothetical protein O3M35_007129 [Rhynocoris fuscipes]|uniref:Paramyosin n=1 Tax=Rhynocoris fuscipes TaxID=488301 RepID=A0AAW1DDY0_9HEMI
MKIYCLIFAIFLMKDFTNVACNRQITHEDIKEAILSMVHLFRDTTDKLERHELRERQLGEQLKKALSSLDKKGRNQDQMLNSIVSKLTSIDDRLRKIESVIAQQDDAAKGAYTVDTVPLQSWMSNLEGMINKQTASAYDTQSNRDKLEAMEAAYNSKIDYLASLIEKLQSDLMQTSSRMSQQFEQQREHQTIEHKKWHNSLLAQIEQQSHKLANINNYNSNNINGANSSIKDELLLAKDDIITIINSGLNKVDNKITQLDYTVHAEEQNLIDTISKSRDMMEDYFRTVNEKFTNIANDINALEKIEKILIQTDENIIDSKRKIEFMMFQIIKSIEESISLQNRNLNDTVNNRFNIITDLIVDNQNITMLNISGKIETEMEQVWRQINMLYTQLSQSSSILNLLRNETETYGNDTNLKMDKMDTRIDSINTHVADMHENVNYFMGRLALITQEFKQTRNALAIVVDNLKIDLDKPKDDKDLGPGPIPIDSGLDNRL